MPDRIYNLLFICTGNSTRSIFAESILQKDGAGRFRAFSVGSQPRGEVNPLALRTLQAWDYPAEGFRSKSWEEFAVPGAPVMDSCSPSATTRPVKSARSGRANL
jgi:arsenate reductase (thioredoxin)